MCTFDLCIRAVLTERYTVHWDVNVTLFFQICEYEALKSDCDFDREFEQYCTLKEAMNAENKCEQNITVKIEKTEKNYQIK